MPTQAPPALNHKIAWITGGGSGIGLAAATALVSAGATVVISGRNAASNAAAIAQLQSLGNAELVALDVGDSAAVYAAAAAIEARHGRIDVLVNSAGTNLGLRSFAAMSAEGWDEVIRVNLSGSFYCCHAVLPGMRTRGDGLIVNVSSWAGRYASALTGPAYNASKRALIALTESINIEEGRHGIRATSVLPGEVATPILDKRPQPPCAAERARMLQGEELGTLIAMLAALPARACVNEIIVSPTWNRFYVGGLEALPAR